MTQAVTATDTNATATITEPVTGTSSDAPVTDSQGQAASQTGTSQTGNPATTQTAEEAFFDSQEYERLSSTLPPELKSQAEALRKALQGSYTKKTQAIAKARDKIQAYENFERDPLGNIQMLANRLGYKLTPAQAAAVQQAAVSEWQPNSWDEVFSKAEERIMSKIQENLAPVFKGVQQVTASNIERQLDGIDQNWRMYEDEMKATIAEHPSLVNDVSKLYRLSVPEETLNSRAVQAALRKLEDKGKAAQLHGSSPATRTAAPAKKATNFNEAVELAKENLRRQGLYK